MGCPGFITVKCTGVQRGFLAVLQLHFHRGPCELLTGCAAHGSQRIALFPGTATKEPMES